MHLVFFACSTRFFLSWSHDASFRLFCQRRRFTDSTLHTGLQFTLHTASHWNLHSHTVFYCILLFWVRLLCTKMPVSKCYITLPCTALHGTLFKEVLKSIQARGHFLWQGSCISGRYAAPFGRKNLALFHLLKKSSQCFSSFPALTKGEDPKHPVKLFSTFPNNSLGLNMSTLKYF